MQAADAFDASKVDLDAFAAALAELRKSVEADFGERDLRHLRKMERIGWAASAVGFATAWVMPNPLSMVALSLGRSTRWLLMHHVGHRGYDKVPGVSPRHTSKVFGKGLRRFVDWPDWMLPEAWIYEHNVLHHGNTGEVRDPDLIERNAEPLRQSGWPTPVRYGAMAFLAASWRFFYYAPNTVRAWLGRKDGSSGESSREADPPGYRRTLWLRCYAPYAALEFLAMPAMYLPLGPWASFSALVNSLGAEVLTNIHTFCVVGPNHTGDDLYRFDSRPQGSGEALLRQVLGSTNYACGNDFVDYGHLWLNYQIEHHIWPDLPMLRYQQLQPAVKALCEEHGIPYVQESIWKRIGKMLQVAVGTTSMKRVARLLPENVSKKGHKRNE